MTRKAFTLIELLVVVAVLALLASIVTSNLAGAREGARISNALSFQSQVHSLLGSDLVVWWNFNHGDNPQCGPGKVCDLSGRGTHGTNNGGIYVDGVTGTGGIAMEFDGINDHVSFPLNIIKPPYSLSFWALRLDDFPSASFVSMVGWRYVTESLQGMCYYSDYYIRYKDYGGSSSLVNTGVVMEKGIWYHITVTHNGDTLRTYIQGEIRNDVNQSPALYTSSEFQVGSTRWGTGQMRSFGGLIDDVRIYSRALSASEIQTLYAQTKDRYLANE